MCVGSTGNVSGDDVNITHGVNPPWMRMMMMDCVFATSGHSRDVRKISLGQYSCSFTPLFSVPRQAVTYVHSGQQRTSNHVKLCLY